MKMTLLATTLIVSACGNDTLVARNDAEENPPPSRHGLCQAGDPTVVLAENVSPVAGNIVFAGDELYYPGSDAIYRLSKNRGAATRVSPLPLGGFLAIVGGDLYATSYDAYTGRALVTRTGADGQREVLDTNDAALNMVASPDGVFWLAYDEGSDSVTTYFHAAGGTTSIAVGTQGGQATHDLVFAGDRLWFRFHEGQERPSLLAFSPALGTTTTVLPGFQGEMSVADGQEIWGSSGDHFVILDASTGATRELSVDTGDPYGLPYRPNSLDAKSVYWTTRGLNSSIYAASRATGELTELVQDDWYLPFVVSDGDCIYFAGGDPNTDETLRLYRTPAVTR